MFISAKITLFKCLLCHPKSRDVRTTQRSLLQKLVIWMTRMFLFASDLRKELTQICVAIMFDYVINSENFSLMQLAQMLQQSIVLLQS